VPSGGNDPAFAVALSTGEVAIMNYSSGDRRIILTTTSPEHFNNDARCVSPASKRERRDQGVL
jgi:hypothetical protein